MDDCETHASALAGPLGCEEGLKEAAEHLRHNARSGIPDRQPDIRPRFEVGTRHKRVYLSSLQAHLKQPPGVAHGILRVRTEIHQDLMHLCGVSEDRARIRGQCVLNLNGGGE